MHKKILLGALALGLVACLAACSGDKSSSASPSDDIVSDDGTSGTEGLDSELESMLDDYLQAQEDIVTHDIMSEGVTFDGITATGGNEAKLPVDATVTLTSFDEGGIAVHVDNGSDGLVSIQGVTVYDGENTIVQDDLVFPEFTGDMTADDGSYAEYEKQCSALYNCEDGGTLDYACTFSRLEKMPKGDFDITVQGYYATGENSQEYFNITYKCKK